MRLVPSSGRSAASTRSTTDGRAPVTSIVWTANIDVPRAATYAPTTAVRAAKQIRSERPDGIRRANGISNAGGRLGNASTAVREVGLRATGTSSSRGLEALQGLAGRRELEIAEEPHLVLQLDAVLLECAPPRFGHQRERVGGGGVSRVLDEVRVPG